MTLRFLCSRTTLSPPGRVDTPPTCTTIVAESLKAASMRRFPRRRYLLPCLQQQVFLADGQGRRGGCYLALQTMVAGLGPSPERKNLERSVVLLKQSRVMQPSW